MDIWRMCRSKGQSTWGHREGWGMDIWRCLGQETSASGGRERSGVWASSGVQNQRPVPGGSEREPVHGIWGCLGLETRAP